MIRRPSQTGKCRGGFASTAQASSGSQTATGAGSGDAPTKGIVAAE